MAVLGAAALLFFGPEQLPRVARKAGNVMREIQNTSQSFIREMERAADMHEQAEVKASTPAPYDPAPYGSTLYDPDGATMAFDALAPPAEAAPAPVGEKLYEPRAAGAEYEPPEPAPSAPAEAAPQPDHPAHL